MQLNSSVSENGDTIVTSGVRLTIETAGDFSKILRESLETSNNVVLEFDTEVEIDITAIQILCSACKSAASSGKTLSFSGLRPQSLLDLITISGVGRNAICKYNNNSTCIWFGGTN